ncbi:DapH/DapD/GlmU-related protein [Streptomyces sp. NPDC006692]|uniref:DapH/DapD/GlmU-related protein n=1 Tax=unclassified Streptomyces TaxID=2593676 RepID=UPI0036D0FD1B
MPTVRLSDYLRAPIQGLLATTPYGDLGGFDLADFLDQWPTLHETALDQLGDERIHPTARVHPTAIIGDDVIIGPHAQVHEFTSVRRRSVVAAGASIGFNCEVTAAFIGEGTVLGHRIGINRTLLGADAHLSANVTVAAIHLHADMRTPAREVLLRIPVGIYRCRTAQFGALIGDHVQTGNGIAIGPGVAIGRHCRLNSGLTVPPTRVLPPHSIVSSTEVHEIHVRPQRRIP